VSPLEDGRSSGAIHSDGAPTSGQTGREFGAGRDLDLEGRDEEFELSKKIYVGNLPFSSTEEDLRGMFERHGSVESVNVIMDRETGRPRGFAFVEMSEESAAKDAIRALDGSDLGGRNIKVNEAQDRQAGGGGRGGYGRSNRY
jgi:RNA recognition motif-containing protein